MMRAIAVFCIHVVAMVLFTTAHACDTGAPILKPEQPSSPLAEIQKFTGTLFPYGATVIRYERQMESDALIRAKLFVTPAQWQGFLGCARLEPDAFEEEKRYLLGSNTDWWNPRDSRQLPTAQARLPGARVLNVGVDRSDPERILVFFVWHRT